MLSRILFALSRSRIAERIATRAPGFRAFSRRFVAGNTHADAVEAVRRLNDAGFDATVSFLGEAVTTSDEVEAAVAEFTGFAEDVARAGLRSHLSIKLTELGLGFDADLAHRSLDVVLSRAAAAGTFVRIDMEDSRYTEAALAMFRQARTAHANTGIVIQAMLRRSADDIVALAKEGAPVRLVKGAYREPEEVALQDKRAVDEAFVRLADAYLASMADGAWLAVASHDGRMLRAALRSALTHAVRQVDPHGAADDRLEFQMLYGIRSDLQRRLRDEGHRVRIYVPYGTHWYPYLMRRLAERPGNLWFFLRNAFRR